MPPHRLLQVLDLLQEHHWIHLQGILAKLYRLLNGQHIGHQYSLQGGPCFVVDTLDPTTFPLLVVQLHRGLKGKVDPNVKTATKEC